jgi:hypothetical protein
MEFELLADSIKQINDKASSAAKSAVNQLMTLRNWAIGYYIVEYEQDGSDRAEYGSHLLKNLEKQIDQKGMNYTLFKACRQFYKVYPQIGSTVSSEFKLPDFGKSSTVSNEFVTDPDVLVNNLSFSHIREIMVLNDAFERFFYETECMKCNWNVRELRRQIKTNLYVRAGERGRRVRDPLGRVAPEEPRDRLLRNQRAHRAGDEERRDQAQQHMRRQIRAEVAQPALDQVADEGEDFHGN